MTHEVEEQKEFREWYIAKWGKGGERCVSLPALFPSWTPFCFFKFSRLFFFNYYYYYLLENITKTRHTEVEGNHLVMNTEVS